MIVMQSNRRLGWGVLENDAGSRNFQFKFIVYQMIKIVDSKHKTNNYFNLLYLQIDYGNG